MIKEWKSACIGVLAAALVLVSSVVFAQYTTVVGTVYNTYEIVTDSGDVFNVVADDKGDELVGLDGVRVRATGVLEIEGGDRFIQVLSYSPLGDEGPEKDGIMEEPLEEELLEEDLLAEDGYPPEEDSDYEDEPLGQGSQDEDLLELDEY
ncbi:MAG: hypothetical protein WAR22_11975 [Desulfomonilia bacterium]|jgi:hypothetical protein